MPLNHKLTLTLDFSDNIQIGTSLSVHKSVQTMVFIEEPVAQADLFLCAMCEGFKRISDTHQSNWLIKMFSNMQT